jgi:homoserine kinase type II
MSVGQRETKSVASVEEVYVLHHVREDDEYAKDAKFIGVYRSKQATEAAVARLSSQPGFRDHPAGFVASRYELDKDHWTEGFIRTPSDDET